MSRQSPPRSTRREPIFPAKSTFPKKATHNTKPPVEDELDFHQVVFGEEDSSSDESADTTDSEMSDNDEDNPAACGDADDECQDSGCIPNDPYSTNADNEADPVGHNHNETATAIELVAGSPNKKNAPTTHKLKKFTASIFSALQKSSSAPDTPNDRTAPTGRQKSTYITAALAKSTFANKKTAQARPDKDIFEDNTSIATLNLLCK